MILNKHIQLILIFILYGIIGPREDGRAPQGAWHGRGHHDGGGII